MEEISQELARELAAAARAVVANWDKHIGLNRECTELRAIVAKLPAAVDPDLVAGREMLAEFYEADNQRLGDEHYFPSMIADVRSGLKDNSPPVLFAVHALKQSRELAKARAGEGSV